MSSFTKEDIMQIRGAIDASYQDNLASLDRLGSGNADPHDRLKLISILAEDLTRNGLEIDDEPNQYGIQIEEIIDKLNQ